MAKPVKIGVIGLGWPGNEHLKGYAAVPNATVVALCDLKADLLAQKAAEFGVKRTFVNYRQMLRQADIDAIDVCLPNDLHARVTVAALQAGKHVLCEKPPARNSREAQKMADQAQKSGKTLMYAVCLRFASSAQYVKAHIQAGDFGDVYWGRTVYHRRRGIPAGSDGWFTLKARSGGGALIDIGVHALDCAWWLMGCPRPVAVSGAVYAKFAHTAPAGVKCNVEDSAFAMIKFANDATLILETSWALNQRGGSILQLGGTKGGVEMHPLTIFTERGGVMIDSTPQVPGNNIYADEIRHFVDCVQHHREPIASAKQGVLLMKMLDAVYASQKSGKEVRIR